MATNKNINEADLLSDDDNDDNQSGWFYHAPAQRRNKDPVCYPPMSQIPGLAEDDGTEVDPIRPLFRDTDTKYIRMAKQGGRQNLLYIKENCPDKKAPVGYPRSEWYYLEDNAIEDACEKQQQEMEYDFLRPDYMVHEPYKKDENDVYNRPGRGMLAHDKLSVFDREPNRSATDKTVRLPELKKPGYGVRMGKPLRIPKTLKQDRNKPPSAQTDPGRGPHPLKYLPMPTDDEELGKPKMGKILSYGYEREWQEQLLNWQDKQDVGRNKHRQMTNIPPSTDPNLQSEYTTNFAKRSSVVHSGSSSRQPDETARSDGKSCTSKSVRQTETQRLREAKLVKPAEKEVFKMTRFKNIPAKIATHRQPQQAC